jgi:hypothetical protein
MRRCGWIKKKRMEMGKRCDGFLFGFGDLVCGSIWPDDVEKARTHIDVDVCVAKHSILYGIEIG